MKKEFTIYSQSYYSANIVRDFVDDININVYNDDYSDEFRIVWHELAGDIVPKLEVWDDAWNVLFAWCYYLLAFMAQNDNKNISVETVATWLKEHGYEDVTKRESPYKEK